jgi:hypothetical protein
MKRSYTFALNCGFAEDGELSYTPFTSEQKFASAKEALIDLAQFFKEHFVEGNTPKLKACCTATRAKDTEAKFCSKCGSSLAVKKFDAEAYTEFVHEACLCDNNSYAELIDYNEEYRWQPGGMEKAADNGSLRFVITAEKVLAAALGESPDERVTIETIFQDRTKAGGKVFSFWGL